MFIQTAIRLTLTLVLFTGIAAAQQAASPENPKIETASIQGEQNQKSENPAFKSWKEKLSYAFGADLAGDIRWKRINIDAEQLIKALKDGLAGKELLMTPDEITATLKRFEAEQKQDVEHARSMRAERNKREGEAFVAENVKKADVVTLPSGLQYKILQKGEGKKPTIEESVVCNYRGTLLDGTEFDSSYKRNQPAILPVKGLIKGWSEALQLMPVGSKWQLFIPPHLAYGDRVVGGIGPNAMLMFEVELISIKERGKEQAASTNSGTQAIR